MKNIAIICDSSVALTQKQANEMGIYIAPLTIIHSDKEFSDQIDISHEEVSELIRNKVSLKTSQPNLGTMINILNNVKEKDYDHIFVLSLTSSLSGTYASFQYALNEVQLDNLSLIDTQSLAGPVQEAIKHIRFLNENHWEPQAITDYLDNVFFKNTESYVYPENLEQLKQGGRISKPAATLASMLKIKVLLKLSNHGDTIDKFKTTRTEQKLIDEIINDLKKNNINPQEHVLYLPHLEADRVVEELIKQIREKIGDFKFTVTVLPAALSSHAGLHTVALQWALDVDNISL
ncbi:DegV family protein [Erysipelothrix urinaevulpis]|uniref:DegV family protein n=1 Tax=Erysipelothrix urinaevulpis TaxID=2683717 RepID=UPI0013571D17|nr:DegV family protein [Erysipelothrix urinaevulpis]